MKSVILGGTSNLGKYVSERLENLGYEIVTVSRSNKGLKDNLNHFQCDVSNNGQLIQTLDTLKRENPIIDNVWCVAGYAHLAKIEDQNQEVLQKNLDRNFTYVKTALEMLKDNLSKGNKPLVITFGSQWSYKFPEQCPELIPYANAKKALMTYTHEFAEANSKIRANHYCIPTTDTHTRREIEAELRNINNGKLPISYGDRADPEMVATALVEHAIRFNGTGKTLLVDPQGLVGLLY